MRRRKQSRLDRMLVTVSAAALITVLLGGFSIVAAKAQTLEQEWKPVEHRSLVVRYAEPEQVEEEKPVLYDVPLEDDLQLHIAGLCEEYHIEPKIVMAIIWHESRYQPEVVGDKGKSFGLMQVQQQFHLERMERLGVTDLLDPKQNVAVGVDILAELIDYYDGDVKMALVAYQNGLAGAETYFFSRGFYENSFSKAVFKKAGEINVRS